MSAARSLARLADRSERRERQRLVGRVHRRASRPLYVDHYGCTHRSRAYPPPQHPNWLKLCGQCLECGALLRHRSAMGTEAAA